MKFHKMISSKLFTIRRFGIVILLFILVYWIWSKWDRNISSENFDPKLDENHIIVYQDKNPKIFVVGIQPWMETTDYQNQSSFYRKLNYYLESAKKQNLITESSIVVFPEYLGTWLVTINEKQSIYKASSINSAMTIMILSNATKFLWYLMKSQGKDKIKDAIFRMKAKEMANVYQNVFSQLAKEYQTIIVAGSILLPSPEIKNGIITVGNGPLENVSAVFGPRGEIIPPLIRKIYPIEGEKSFIQNASLESLPTFSTQLVKFGVMICADSWYPDVYQKLKEGNVDILLVPSYIAGNGAWNQPWNGYSGWPAPNDINPKDVLKLTEGEAWLKYSLIGRISLSGARIGMNVFLRGNLWDLGSDGMTIAIFKNRPLFGPYIQGASILGLGWNTTE